MSQMDQTGTDDVGSSVPQAGDDGTTAFIGETQADLDSAATADDWGDWVAQTADENATAATDYAQSALNELEQNGPSEYSDYLMDNADQYSGLAHGESQTADEYHQTADSYLAEASTGLAEAQSGYDATGTSAADLSGSDAVGYDAGSVDAGTDTASE